MQPPHVVDQIFLLQDQGWGTRRIAHELQIGRNTVKRYLRQGKWHPYCPAKRVKRLQHLGPWIEEQFIKHKGNAEVVRQELDLRHGIKVSARTVQYAVAPLRAKILAQAQATVRFETPPGKQMQIDFGSMKIKIGGVHQRVYFFVTVLGYSRRQYVQAFLHDRQTAWLEGIEGAFYHFGGVAEQILLDNAKSLVVHHNPQTREVTFNERFRAFAAYWKFVPKACAPYRARTKGKDECSVKYLKINAIAGREFDSFAALEAHLVWWLREISDPRDHGTTGEKPIDRFLRDEKNRLEPVEGRPPFYLGRELQRVVQTDACVEVDSNSYSVPWSFIKQLVAVQITGTEVVVFHESQEIARHGICEGRRQRSVDPQHLTGIVGAQFLKERQTGQKEEAPIVHAELLRPLADYEAAIGGGW